MEEVLKWIIVFSIISSSSVLGETFSVRVGTERHINEVDAKFLSFTVDPKYLFLSETKLNSSECTCMAEALAPAFLRIAGPSTGHMALGNATITLQDQEENQRITVTHDQWQSFASWTKNTGFEPVFALNNAEKTNTGLWDPNSAISTLSEAERSGLGGVYWQLGYECKNQSIEEYLTDLQTLKVIVDTFPAKDWKVVGGDVGPCLQEQSKSDFKDYVALSSEMMDAVLLDGNSSSYELERMSDRDRNRLLTHLAQSPTPLWLTEQAPINAAQGSNQLARAASWMHSLGHAARNGFAVHFRELAKNELFEPTLSFYMALLFKNLVGERVLDLTFNEPSERASLFAHCTSLRRRRVSGAITLFGANLHDEPTRFALQLGGREEGGDIMQFVLGLDASGNIIVNGRPMYYEGDIKPVVRRVRPYKTLIINLPAKSFGFWVLANTKTEACQDTPVSTEKTVTEDGVNEENLEEETRTKRSTEVDLEGSSHVNEADTSEALMKRVENINKELKNVHKLSRHERVSDNDYFDLKRDRRQVKDERKTIKEMINARKTNIASKPSESKMVVKEVKLQSKPKLSFANRLAEINARLNSTRQQRKERAKKLLQRNKVTKRNSDKIPDVKHRIKFPEISSKQLPKLKLSSKIIDEKSKEEIKNKTEGYGENKRSKRSVLSKKKKFDEDVKELLPENEIDLDDGKYLKFGKILHKMNEQLNDITEDYEPSSKETDSLEEQLTVKTRISGDDASIKLSEKSSGGLFKSTVSKVLSLLEELTEKFDSMLNTVDVMH